MKNIWRVTLFACVILAMIRISVFPVSAAPKLDEAEYKGYGIVEAEFESDVLYHQVKVAAADTRGHVYSTRILSKDKKELKFRINNYVPNRMYVCRIIGIRRKSCCPWQTLSFRILIPKTTGGISVREIEYEEDEREVDFKFHQNVQWKNPKVTISDGSRNYVIRIHEREDNEIEVLVRKLKKGSIYKYTISGVRKKGLQKYVVLTGTFKA